MQKKNNILKYEKLKLGLFVHFGLYSIVGKGEWYMHNENIEPLKYEKLIHKFKVNKNWVKDLVVTAKKLGFKYITLTTRHHDGFSLYNTLGLTDYDVVHSPTKRDLVKEFVDECRKNDIVPFFYATLIDWHNELFKNNFQKYLEYLQKSIEILCTNYGKIGGFWFDGTWNDKNTDWQFNKLFAIIKKYQPDALIINNGGLENRGEIIHKDIDVITFERDKPNIVSKFDNKYRAKEMCQTLNNHWGYHKKDKNYKTVESLVDDFNFCMENNSNFLLNTGPKKNGKLNKKDLKILKNFSTQIRR